MSLPIPFVDAALDFAGAQGVDFASAGPSASGDIRGGNVDFGSFNIPGISRSFGVNNAALFGIAAIAAIVFIVIRK